jgi:hypothetical protein
MNLLDNFLLVFTEDICSTVYSFHLRKIEVTLANIVRNILFPYNEQSSAKQINKINEYIKHIPAAGVNAGSAKKSISTTEKLDQYTIIDLEMPFNFHGCEVQRFSLN